MSILSILFFTAISGGGGGWWTACCPCSCPRLGFRLPVRFSWALNFVSLVLVSGLQTVCLSAPFLSVPSVCPVCLSCLSVCLSWLLWSCHCFIFTRNNSQQQQELQRTTCPLVGYPRTKVSPPAPHPCWSNLLPPSPIEQLLYCVHFYVQFLFYLYLIVILSICFAAAFVRLCP